MPIDIAAMDTDIKTSQGQIKNLQHATIECVAFSASGKVTVTDKERLEDLNSEIDRLGELVNHNAAVLTKLYDCLQKAKVESVEELRQAITRREQEIASCKIGINRIIGTWLKADPTYTIETIGTHPKVKDETAKREARILEEQKRLRIMTPALEEAESILEDFQPSGLKPMEITGAHAITRESVAGFGL